MADVTYTIDVSDVEKAKAALKAWAAQNKKTVAQIKADLAIESSLKSKSLKETISSNNKRVALHKQREQANKQAEASIRKEYAKSLQLQKLREAEAKKEAAAVQRLDTEYDKYRASIDDVYAAQLKYNKLSQTITQRNKAMGVSVEQTTMELEELRLKFAQVGVQMDAMGNVTSTVGRNFNQFGEVGQKSGKSMSRFNMQVQQGGYQLQDFVVQVQGGTSALTAFSQQGSQFAGIFGPAGAIVGAGIAIGSVIAQLGIAYFKNSEGADEAKEAQESLTQSLESTLDSLKANTVAWEELRAGMFSGQTGFSRGIEGAKEQLEAAQEELKSSMGNWGPYGLGMVMLALEAGKVEEATTKVAEAQANYNKFLDESLAASQRFTDSELGSIQQRIELLNLEAQYGAESSEVKEQLLQIEKEALATKLMSEGVDPLMISYAQNLLEVEAKIAQELSDQQELKESALRKEEELNAQREKAQDYIVAQTELLVNRIALLSTEAEYGKDSSEYAAEVAQQHREAYEAQLEANDIYGDNAKMLLAMYDSSVDITSEINSATSASQSWANTLSAVGAEISAIISGLASIGGGMIANAAKASELTALQAGSSVRDAAIARDRTTREAEWSARGQGANIFERGQIALERGNYEYGLELDAELDAARAAAREAAKTSSGGGSSGGGGGSSRDRLAELNAELAQRRELLSVFGAERDFLEAIHEVEKSLGDDRSKYSGEQIEILANQIIQLDQLEEAQKKAEQALKDRQKEQESIIKGMTDSFANSYNSIVDGTMTVKEAFRSMAADVITQLHNILITQKLVGSFDAASGVGTGLAGFLGGFFADGAAFSGGNVVPFATGGVVNSATAFPMSGGRTGVMGEAGPEAIMPLTRGPDGSLGVKAQGGSGGQTISISIDARGAQVGVAEQIEQKLRQVAPQIVGQSVVATKKSMQKTKKGWA